MAVNSVEWNQEVKPTSVPAVRNALNAGDPLPGNLVVARDPREWFVLRDLCAAFSVDEGLAFACPASQEALAPTLAVWWKSPKQAPRPHRLKLDVFQMTECPGPEPRPPTQVAIKRISESEQCTLRLSAPEVYRSSFSRHGCNDTPSGIVAEWAKILEIRTAPLTGGHWQTVQDGAGTVLVGYLRVPMDLAERAVAASGKRGLFASIVAKNGQRDKIKWLQRDRSSCHEDFFRYCLAQAEAQNKPLVFRQGGGKI